MPHRSKFRSAGPSSREGRALHEGLTGERGLVGTAYMAEPGLRAAYARDLAPRTRAALARILEQHGVGARLRELVEGRGRRLRVLDLGSGTGAVETELDAYFGGDGVERVAVERVDLHVVGPGIRNLDLASPSAVGALGGGFDLVVAGHLLNELWVDLHPEQRLPKLGDLVGRWATELLGPGGLLVLIEPALRETSRALLAVRDRVLAAGSGVRVLAPCLFRGPCPALERERDWCHDATPGIETRRRVDFSYLVLGSGAAAAATATRGEDDRPDGKPSVPPSGLVRVVSDPLVEKGKLRIFVCGDQGRFPLVRLDRQASAQNRAMDALVRGDLARIPVRPPAPAPGLAANGSAGETTHADGVRVGPDWSIERLGPARLR